MTPENTNNVTDGELIDIVTKLQEAQESLRVAYADTASTNMSNVIDLPRIAVVGMQSAGKSSVLESIVGFDFLPRGINQVTKRPIVVHLKNSEVEQASISETHQGEDRQISTDMGELVGAIAEKNRMVKKVTDEKLFVEIQGPKKVDLTLVDLPGLIAGDSSDIEAMVEKEIKNKKTIILLIHAANGDPMNDMALNLVKRVDPEGERTIGVLTKLDQLTETKELENVYENFFGDKSEKLANALKWIPVRNRSTDEAKYSIEYQREKEDDLFRRRTDIAGVFKSLVDKNEFGINFLIEKLKSELVTCIRNSGIKLDLEISLRTMEKELADLTDDFPDTKSLASSGWRKILYFLQAYKSLISGSALTGQGLAAGAEIVSVFEGNFSTMMRDIDPLSGYRENPEKLDEIIKNARGVKNDLFIPYTALQRIVKDAIDGQVKGICQKCLDDVCEVLSRHAQNRSSKTGLDE